MRTNPSDTMPKYVDYIRCFWRHELRFEVPYLLEKNQQIELNSFKKFLSIL